MEEKMFLKSKSNSRVKSIIIVMLLIMSMLLPACTDYDIQQILQNANVWQQDLGGAKQFFGNIKYMDLNWYAFGAIDKLGGIRVQGGYATEKYIAELTRTASTVGYKLISWKELPTFVRSTIVDSIQNSTVLKVGSGGAVGAVVTRAAGSVAGKANIALLMVSLTLDDATKMLKDMLGGNVTVQ
jgi:hypothetical protein